MNDCASYELRVFLRGIAEQLKRTQSATGRPDQNGLSKISFINVRIQYWRELGSILERVAKGEDARRLFGQHERTKPKKDGEHRLRGLAYWSVRARDPDACDADAVALARRIVPALKTLTGATIRKYAQRHRLRCLLLLSCATVWVLRFEDTDIQIRLLGHGIEPLMKYLMKKESRERWSKPPNFRGMWDVLYHVPKRSDGGPSIPEPAFPGMSIASIDAE